ncbi:MAG TPA: hypothetical protein VFB42_13290 [Gaiellaceae bacterium]|nr:hypothetical protein [Gaiellaceae bacterium]
MGPAAAVTAAIAAALGLQHAPSGPAGRALRLPPVPPGPVPGYVLVADRDNNRVLLVSPARRVVWRYDGLRGPDDAFFTPGWRTIVTNEEFDDTITEVSLRRRRPVWRYGHAGVAGSSPGYLNTPDDAYRLRDGSTTVADIRNCRVVRLAPSGAVERVLGGRCTHDPPRGFASPNGDTPLADGGLLVTEIGGWIDRLDARGRLVWSVRSPVPYPSDAQLLPSGRILVASFTTPGRIVELTRRGRIVWSFGTPTGPDLLRKPSLAVRWPNGMIAATDDYGDRVIVIDPARRRIVWQYGHTGVASSAPGYLSKPDGLDLLPAPQLGARGGGASASTASARRGQASFAHSPNSRSVRHASASPASGSTQRKVPLRPKWPKVRAELRVPVQWGALPSRSSSPSPQSFGASRPNPGSTPSSPGNWTLAASASVSGAIRRGSSSSRATSSSRARSPSAPCAGDPASGNPHTASK